MERKGPMRSSVLFPNRMDLLSAGSFSLLSPAALHRFGDALSTFRCKISFLGSFSSCRRCGSSVFPYRRSSQQGTGLLQLGNLSIELSENLRNPHGSSSYWFSKWSTL